MPPRVRNERDHLTKAVARALRTDAQATGAWFQKLGASRWVVGLPDFIGVVDGRAVAIELKHPTDLSARLSGRQRVVLRAMHRAGARVCIARQVVDVTAFLVLVRRGWSGWYGEEPPETR